MQSLYKPNKRRNISTCQHWLSGLLKCGYCGSSLSWNGRSGSSPGFQCWKYSKGFHKESCSISEAKITAAVEEYFKLLLVGADFEYAIQAPESDERNFQKESLLEELKKIDNRELRIRLAFENEVDTLEEYRQNKERLKKARMDVLRQLEDLEQAPKDNVPSKEVALEQIRTVYDVIENPDVDYETKGTFMRSIVKEIVYDKKNKQINFRLYTSQTP